MGSGRASCHLSFPCGEYAYEYTRMSDHLNVIPFQNAVLKTKLGKI